MAKSAAPSAATLCGNLIEDARKGVFKPVYLLMGEEPYYPELLCRAIIDNCIGEYGVCIDNAGKLRYLIAGRYTGGDVPDGMTLFEFPQGEWVKFKCKGPMPDALQSLNTKVFKEWLPGNPEFEIAGGYNIEWYSCDGEKTDENYESGIWVPVKRK